MYPSLIAAPTSMETTDLVTEKEIQRVSAVLPRPYRSKAICPSLITSNPATFCRTIYSSTVIEADSVRTITPPSATGEEGNFSTFWAAEMARVGNTLSILR